MPKNYDPYEELDDEYIRETDLAKYEKWREEKRIERESKYSPRVQRKIQEERRTGKPAKESKISLFFMGLIAELIAVGFLIVFLFL